MDQVPEGFECLNLGRGFSNILGLVYLHRARRQLGFRAVPALGNPVDTLHGGALATFADLQIAALMQSAEQAKPHRPTVSLSIDYVAPIPLGSWVQADVTLVRETRTLVFTTALITADGVVVVRSNAIYRNRARIGGDV